MKYLVLHNDKFELMDNMQDVRVKALVATFEWCQDPNYEGDDWKELYQECLRDKDFGDIIKIYEIVTNEENFVEFYYCDVGDTFTLKRIL